MALASSKFPGSKEIAIVSAVSILVYAIIFGLSWTQMLAYYITSLMYAIVISFVAPLVSLYLDHKNPLVSSQAKAVNKKKLVVISMMIACSAAVAIATALFAADWISFNILSDAFMITLMIVVPLVSLYFDHYKNLTIVRADKKLNLAIITLVGTVSMFAIAFMLYQNFTIMSWYSMLGTAAATVFIAPLISLYFDYKNPLIGAKNRKPSRTKAIITIAVGFLLILTIVGTAYLHLVYYL